MQMTDRADPGYPRALPRWVRSEIRRRAHQLAQEAYGSLVVAMIDDIVNGAVRVDEVSHWRPEPRG